MKRSVSLFVTPLYISNLSSNLITLLPRRLGFTVSSLFLSNVLEFSEWVVEPLVAR